MEIPDRSAELGHQDASMYRTCVGILLYLLVDLPQCQYVIRYLPSFSSKPTEKSLTVLKDLHVLFGTKMIALFLGSMVFCIVSAKHVDLLHWSRV